MGYNCDAFFGLYFNLGVLPRKEDQMVLVKIYNVSFCQENLEKIRDSLQKIFEKEVQFLFSPGKVQEKEEGMRGSGLIPTKPFIEVLLPLSLFRYDLEAVARMLSRMEFDGYPCTKAERVLFIPLISFSFPKPSS